MMDFSRFLSYDHDERVEELKSRSFITMRNQRGYGTQKNWMAVSRIFITAKQSALQSSLHRYSQIMVDTTKK